MALSLDNDGTKVVPVKGSKLRSFLVVLMWVSVPVLIHFAVLQRYLIDAPVLDDFNFLDTMYAMTKASGFADWFKAVVSLQNEHRAATTRLIPQALAWLTGSVDFRLLNVCGTLFVLGTFGFILGEHDHKIAPPVIGAGAFLLLQWSYNEALMQASGALPHLGVVFFAFSGLFFALRPGWKSSAGSAVCGVLAAFSQANGLLVLPIATAGCLAMGLRKRAALFAVLAALVWWFYFSNYVRPPNHPSLLSAFQAPINAIRLFLVIIGGVVPSLAISQAVGGAILIAVGWITWKGHWRRHPTVFLWLAFVLLSAATVSAARAGFGLFYGSRYAVNAALLMTLVLFAIYSLTGPWNRHVCLSVFVLATALSLTISYAALPEIRERTLRASLLTEWEPVPATSTLGRYAGLHYPDASWATRILSQAAELGIYHPHRKTPVIPTCSGSEPRPNVARQGGVVDEIAVTGRLVTLRGWSDIPFVDSSKDMLLYPATGIVATRVDGLEVRQDVALALHRPDLLLSGFRLVVEYATESQAIQGANAICVFVAEKGQPASVLSRSGVNCEKRP